MTESKIPRLRVKYQYLAVLLWTLVAFTISYRRSMWCDEWKRVQDLKNGTLWAVSELLNEPSPFHPGEAVFNGVMKAIVVGLFGGPTEIWARAQEIFWGAATLALAFKYSQKDRERGKYLPCLIAFSAALISLSTQMRPYASLYFSGAIAARVLQEGKIKDRSEHVLSWLLILCGHLYGICFLIFSLVITGQVLKELKKSVIGIALVIWVLFRGHVQTHQGQYSMSVLDYLRQTLGTLSNPHKAILILGPMFLWGVWSAYKKSSGFTWKALALLTVTVAGPIAATVSAKYFFVPRQIVGGCFVFLLFASEGFAGLERLLSSGRYRWVKLGAPWVLCLAVSLVPWTMSTVLKIPPFPDQPFNLFKEISLHIVRQHWKSVLTLDVCNSQVLVDYLNAAEGTLGVETPGLSLQGNEMNRYCWPSGLCLSWPTNYACSSSAEDFMPGGRALIYVNDPRFQAFVYSSMQPITPPSTGIIPLRDW